METRLQNTTFVVRIYRRRNERGAENNHLGVGGNGLSAAHKNAASENDLNFRPVFARYFCYQSIWKLNGYRSVNALYATTRIRVEWMFRNILELNLNAAVGIQISNAKTQRHKGKAGF